MNNSEQPLILTIAVVLFFANGVFACLSAFFGQGIDALAIASIFVALGIMNRKTWPLIALKILAGLSILSAILISLSFVFPSLFNGTGEAYLSFFDKQWEMAPSLALAISLVVTVLYYYVAFSAKSRVYFART